MSVKYYLAALAVLSLIKKKKKQVFWRLILHTEEKDSSTQ